MFLMKKQTNILHLVILSIFALIFNLIQTEKTRETTTTSLPNIAFLGMGIDLIIGQPTTLSLRAPIATFTNALNNIFNFDGTIYSIPDQIDVINVPIVETDTTVALFTSNDSVKESLLFQLSLGFELPVKFPAMFSASAEMDYFQLQSKDFASYTASTYQLYDVWKASIDGEYQLNQQFLDALIDLPRNYSSETCWQYFQFFDVFGTHFLNDIIFGGMITMSTSFTIDYFNSSTQFEINQELQQQFLLELNKDSLTSEQQQQLTNLDAIYSSSFVIQGGYPQSYSPDQYEEWSKTISLNPVPLSFNSILIVDIVPQNESYPRENLFLALMDYLGESPKCVNISATPSPVSSPSSILSPSMSPFPSPTVSCNSDQWSKMTLDLVVVMTVISILSFCCFILIIAAACYFYKKKKENQYALYN